MSWGWGPRTAHLLPEGANVACAPEGKFWISYDGASLELDRFIYKDGKGERDLQGVSIVKAEDGAGYTIIGRTWKIKNLVPDEDKKRLVGTFEQGTVQNRIL